MTVALEWGVRPPEADTWTQLPDRVTIDAGWLALKDHAARTQMAQLLSSLDAAGVAHDEFELPGTQGNNIAILIDSTRVSCCVDPAGNCGRRASAAMTLLTQPLPMHAARHLGKLCPMPTTGWDNYAALAELRHRRGCYESGARVGELLVQARMRSRLASPAGLRRQLVAARALDWFGGQAVTRELPADLYEDELTRSRVMFHTGGHFINAWDRATAQAFSLGVPVVRPSVFAIAGWERPRPGAHYLACRDDCADARDLIQRLLDDAPLRAKIGAAARQFYDANVAPMAAWRRAAFVLHAT